MSLTLVAVPIGHIDDITIRALKTLQESDLVIGEERKPLFRLFKQLQIGRPKDFRLLNEHSTREDIQELCQFCANINVALVTDCGTPGFSDPGAELVALCRKKGIPVTANPGASSLTTFLSLCGVRLENFDFRGFLPREADKREIAIKALSQISQPTIIMDTPYRLHKTLQQMATWLNNKKITLAMDLTKESERVLTGTPQDVLKKFDGHKREFLILIH